MVLPSKRLSHLLESTSPSANVFERALVKWRSITITCRALEKQLTCGERRKFYGRLRVAVSPVDHRIQFLVGQIFRNIRNFAESFAVLIDKQSSLKRIWAVECELHNG